MKTTIELSDALAHEIKALAKRRSTTLRALVEQGIRQVLRDAQHADAFRLADKSVAGNGLQTEFRGQPWAAIRNSTYEERGG